jgi:integrase
LFLASLFSSQIPARLIAFSRAANVGTYGAIDAWRPLRPTFEARSSRGESKCPFTTVALRVSELVTLRWQQIHLDTATVDIRRAKNGTAGIHGLQGDELRLLRALRREHPHADFVFLSERKAPLSVDGAQKLIERLGVAAELPFPIHAHMLRHAAGYALAGRGVDTRTLQAFMGHRSIANTVVYTAVADKRIRNIWSK